MTSRTFSFSSPPILGLLLTVTALPAPAAPVNYEMNLRTASGMGTGGVSGMMGAMFGGKGGNVSHSLDLRLTNPSDIPPDYSATHTVPEALRIGPALALKGERRSGESGRGERSEPDGRVLIYWGCSSTVAKGQPEIIDFKALAGQVPPEVLAMARQGSRSGKGAGPVSPDLPPHSLAWPAGDREFKGIPEGASAVGEHVVQANFMSQDIRFTLGREMDFLEPLNLKAQATNTKAAIPLSWDVLSRARGYDLNAVGANGDKEVVLWMAAKGKSPMLPGSQHECTIPDGVFAKSEMAMVSAVAHGPTQGFAYPPQKPGEKKPLVWTAKVGVTAFDSAMVGMGEAAGNAAGAAAADSVAPGVGGLLKGIFGR